LGITGKLGYSGTIFGEGSHWLMSRKWIFIEPQDVWMFRTSKPFTAGQSFVARSTFPPNPQTMQGIIRTHVIEQSGIDWRDFGTRRDESLLDKIGAPATRNGQKATLGNNFAIRGPFVAKDIRTDKERQENKPIRVKMLVPNPQDVMKRKDNDQLALLTPRPADFETDLPFAGWQPLTLADVEGEYEVADGWLDQENLRLYLQGEVPKQLIRQAEVFLYDERVGLAIDYGRRASREHHLYHAEFVRPCNGVGLLVEVDADLLPDAGYINVGGESRSAYYETVDFQPPAFSDKNNLKIVVLTPAYFSDGWQPKNEDWSPWVGPNARLVSIALGRPMLISGWDTARRQPKPLHHYIPVGSVFYFENAQVPSQPFTETIPDKDFEGGEIDAGRLGFGDFTVGTW
jgi:CRISPR-associated protein Cmr3